MLALAVAGNPLAAIFASPDSPIEGASAAIGLLQLKMDTYEVEITKKKNKKKKQQKNRLC